MIRLLKIVPWLRVFFDSYLHRHKSMGHILVVLQESLQSMGQYKSWAQLTLLSLLPPGATNGLALVDLPLDDAARGDAGSKNQEADAGTPGT